MEKNCAYCKQPFDAKGRGLYCSKTHRELAYRQRKGLPLTPFKGGHLSADTAQIYETKITQLQKENTALKKFNDAFRGLVNEAVPIIIECAKGKTTSELQTQAKTFLTHFRGS